jgi:hypothetical protein
MVRANSLNAMKNKPLMLAFTSAVVLFSGAAALPLFAQPAVPAPMLAYQPLSDSQLDQLLGPIALYPDPLLAQLLPAATLPGQIVLADRYLAGGGDPNSVDQQPWDASVQALARYPAVLQYLDDNLPWTTELGQAFLNQQQLVMDSIQRLRRSAENEGNLVSTPQQQVVDDNGEIEILPADPAVVYVPVYQPDYVYVQSGFGLGFGFACTIGPWLNCDFDWHHHHLFLWDQNHPRPADWWHERPAQRDAGLARETTVWRAQDHRDGMAASRTDRGWDQPAARTPANYAQPPVQPRPASPRDLGSVREAVPVHVPDRPAPVYRPAANDAYIGSESSREARTFSDRGHQSMQEVTHSEPARSAAPEFHPAPSAPNGGGGGGGSHGSGSSSRH